MKVLVVIPHFYEAVGDGREPRHGSSGRNSKARLDALDQTIASLHQNFGSRQCMIELQSRVTRAANEGESVDVVVCTTAGKHLLEQLSLDDGYFAHCETDAAPHLLGYECHQVMRDRLGVYDYYCYLEDDLIVHDAWFFRKLAWFVKHVGDDALLQPHRFERSRNRIADKVYIDGALAPRVTAAFQDVNEQPIVKGRCLDRQIDFVRTLNPHSGCFFLREDQMRRWSEREDFLDRATNFIGPLESAATLGVMRAFRIYKTDPRYADFLEIEHFGCGFLSRIRRKDDGK